MTGSEVPDEAASSGASSITRADDAAPLELAAAVAICAAAKPVKGRGGWGYGYFLVAVAVHILAVGLLLQAASLFAPVRLWLTGGTGSGKTDSPLAGNAGERGVAGTGASAAAAALAGKLLYAEPTLPGSDPDDSASSAQQSPGPNDDPDNVSSSWWPDTSESRLYQELSESDLGDPMWVGVRLPPARLTPRPTPPARSTGGEAAGSSEGDAASHSAGPSRSPGDRAPTGPSGGADAGENGTARGAAAPGPASAGSGTGTGAGDTTGTGEGGMGGGAPSPHAGNRPPTYPPLALRQRIEGTVLLRIDVSADGRVRTVRIANSSGSDLLDHAALEAVREWKFQPARRGGIAESAQADVPIRFVLH